MLYVDPTCRLPRLAMVLALAGFPSGRAFAQFNGPIWGSAPSGPPAPWVTDIDPGFEHFLALTYDGSLLGWGANAWGQAGTYPNRLPSPLWKPPPGTSSPGQTTTHKFHKVSAGYWHSAGIVRDDANPDNDGTIEGWGFNNDGECDAPAGFKWFAVGVGERFTAGLVYAPGKSEHGQLKAWGVPCLREGWYCDPAGSGTTRVAADAPRAGSKRFVSLSVSGGHHGLCLTSDGEMFGFGYNNWGQAGFIGMYECTGGQLGTCIDPNAVQLPGSPSTWPDLRWRAVAAGHYHSVGVTTGGTVLAWGFNDSGQCAVPTTEIQQDVAIHGIVVAVAAGHDDSSVVYADGRIRKWGGTSTPPPCPQPNNGYCIPNIATLVSDHWDDLAIEERLPGIGCYPNCDGSTTAPVLNSLDTACFLNLYAAGNTWANCDGSTAAPVLNANDFACFLNLYAAGCTHP